MTFLVVSSLPESHLTGDEKERRIGVYRGCDDTLGLPPRIYRMPEEIREDIRELRLKIAEINSRLNIRELLLELVTVGENIAPEDVVPALENMLAEAEEALSRLKELRAELSVLEAELYEVKCEMQT